MEQNIIEMYERRDFYISEGRTDEEISGIYTGCTLINELMPTNQEPSLLENKVKATE